MPFKINRDSKNWLNATLCNFFSRDTQFFWEIWLIRFFLFWASHFCAQKTKVDMTTKSFFAVSTNQPRVFPRPLTPSQWGHNFSEVVLQIIFHKGVSDLETCLDYFSLQEEVVKIWIFLPICLKWHLLKSAE